MTILLILFFSFIFAEISWLEDAFEKGADYADEIYFKQLVLWIILLSIGVLFFYWVIQF